MTVFKIRRKTDGKFSLGTGRPYFNETGICWYDRRTLNRHIGVVKGLQRGRSLTEHSYYDCEIVEYELNETQVVQDVVDDKYRKQHILKTLIREVET